jgi:tRNA(Ile)-lysidine synthase TilS/MesJ
LLFLLLLDRLHYRAMTTLPTPPKALMRPVGRAIADFDMIREGDRIAIGVSGGKDSLTLLNILRHLQCYAPVKFELAALTVDPQVEGFDPAVLKPYMAQLGVPYFYRSSPIMAQAKAHMDNDSFCAYCSRMKRGIMYSTLREEGYNVLALAQHLDDLAESFLMSAFHGGQLRTMKANYINDAGDVRIIRPLVYARERQTAAYAREAILPVVPDSCPACFDIPTQRQHMKELLAREEQGNHGLFKSLLTALKPLMHEDYYAEKASDESIVQPITPLTPETVRPHETDQRH